MWTVILLIVALNGSERVEQIRGASSMMECMMQWQVEATRYLKPGEKVKRAVCMLGVQS